MNRERGDMRRRLGREAIRAVRRIAAPLPGRPRMARNGLALGAMPAWPCSVVAMI